MIDIDDEESNSYNNLNHAYSTGLYFGSGGHSEAGGHRNSTACINQSDCDDIMSTPPNSALPSVGQSPKSPALTTLHQKKMDLFLTKAASEVCDPYAELKMRKFKVYSQREIEMANYMDVDYKKFWNTESLRLVNEGKYSKDDIYAKVVFNWNTYARFDALMAKKKDLLETYPDLDADFDLMYRKQVEDCQSRLKVLQAKIVAKEVRKSTQRHHISKVAYDELTDYIESLKKDVKAITSQLTRINRNWSKRVNELSKLGPTNKTKSKAAKSHLPKTAVHSSDVDLSQNAQKRKSTGVASCDTQPTPKRTRSGRKFGRKRFDCCGASPHDRKKSRSYDVYNFEQSSSVDCDSYGNAGQATPPIVDAGGSRTLPEYANIVDKKGCTVVEKVQVVKRRDDLFVDLVSVKDTKIFRDSDILPISFSVNITHGPVHFSVAAKYVISDQPCVEYSEANHWVREYFIALCQFPLNQRDCGSSACVCISAKLVALFLENEIELPADYYDIEACNLFMSKLRGEMSSVIETANRIWTENHLGSISVAEYKKFAFGRPLIRYKHKEYVWHDTMAKAIRPEDWFYDFHDAMMSAIEHRNEQSFAVIVTTGGNSFTMLFTETVCCVYDSHVFYETDQQTFEDAVKIDRCRGRVFISSREHYSHLILRLKISLLNQRLTLNEGAIDVFTEGDLTGKNKIISDSGEDNDDFDPLNKSGNESTPSSSDNGEGNHDSRPSTDRHGEGGTVYTRPSMVTLREGEFLYTESTPSSGGNGEGNHDSRPSTDRHGEDGTVSTRPSMVTLREGEFVNIESTPSSGDKGEVNHDSRPSTDRHGEDGTVYTRPSMLSSREGDIVHTESTPSSGDNGKGNHDCRPPTDRHGEDGTVYTRPSTVSSREGEIVCTEPSAVNSGEDVTSTVPSMESHVEGNTGNGPSMDPRGEATHHAEDIMSQDYDAGSDAAASESESTGSRSPSEFLIYGQGVDTDGRESDDNVEYSDDELPDILQTDVSVTFFDIEKSRLRKDKNIRMCNDKRSDFRYECPKDEYFRQSPLKSTWADVSKTLIARASSKSLSIVKRVRAVALIALMDDIETQVVVPLQDAKRIYIKHYGKEAKSCTEKYECKLPVPKLKGSTDFRDFLFRNLPVSLYYGEDANRSMRAFVVRTEGVDVDMLKKQINFVRTSRIVGTEIAKIAPYIRESLNFCKTETDRHLALRIIHKLTSKEFVAQKLGYRNFNINLPVLEEKLDKFKKACEDNMDRYALSKFKTELHAGSSLGGRELACDKHPLLTRIMFELFSSTGELKSHPRLICGTLYLESNAEMNMRKIQLILEKVYNIKLSLSTLYSYTNNTRAGSYQERRHHGDLNADISLKRSTRDKTSNPSINSHHQKACMKYLLKELELGSDFMAGVARDNKVVCQNKALLGN